MKFGKIAAIAALLNIASQEYSVAQAIKLGEGEAADLLSEAVRHHHHRKNSLAIKDDGVKDLQAEKAKLKEKLDKSKKEIEKAEEEVAQEKVAKKAADKAEAKEEKDKKSAEKEAKQEAAGLDGKSAEPATKEFLKDLLKEMHDDVLKKVEDTVNTTMDKALHKLKD